MSSTWTPAFAVVELSERLVRAEEALQDQRALFQQLLERWQDKDRTLPDALVQEWRAALRGERWGW
jgi:hypothetical protein